MSNQALLTGILVVVVFLAGFIIGRMTASEDIDMPSMNNPLNNDESVESESGGEGATVSASQLTPGQRELLEALGIDANEINITPAMIACAEAELGEARVAEIRAGATPSFGEGMKLAGCYY